VLNHTRNSELKLESATLLREYQQYRSRLFAISWSYSFGLVRKEAHYWSNQCTENYDDLLQVGCIGLIQIERFDMSRKCLQFVCHSLHSVKFNTTCGIRCHGAHSPALAGATAAVRGIWTCEKHNRQPTDSEVAEALEISAEQWQEIKLAYIAPLLDIPVQDAEEGATCLGEMVPDTQYRSFQLA